MPVTNKDEGAGRVVATGVAAPHDLEEARRALDVALAHLAPGDLKEVRLALSKNLLSVADSLSLSPDVVAVTDRIGSFNRVEGLLEPLFVSAELAHALLGSLAAASGATSIAIRVLGAPSKRTADPTRLAFEAVVDAVTQPQVPSPAWFAQARRNAEARQAFLDEFGALTSEQVASLAGSQAANRRSTAHRWQTERKLFAVSHHGQVLYPGFQFDAETGRPKPAVGEALAALPPTMTGWALALWWVTPVDLLDWARPVDRLDSAAAEVVDAARLEAADWAEAEPA